MSLFLLTCPPLVDTFRIGTHTLFKISLYISLFLTLFHLAVARLLPSLMGFFLAIASGLSIYTHSPPVLSPFWIGLSIYTYSPPCTILFSAIPSHGANFILAPAFLLNFEPFLHMARTSFLPLHFFWLHWAVIYRKRGGCDLNHMVFGICVGLGIYTYGILVLPSLP